MTQSNGQGNILAAYKNLRIGIHTDPQGMRHGAHFENKRYKIGVIRDFDDRKNVIERELHANEVYGDFN